MSKMLTLESISFPNFKNDDSKKNFRMVYFITCDVEEIDAENKPIKNTDGTTKTKEITILAEKPKSKDAWQWEKETKNLYLPPINKQSDPVTLDLSRLKTNDFGFQADNYRIEKFVGKLKSVRVQIYDVHDKNFGDYFKKVFAVIGSDAIKLGGGFLGLPAAVTDLIAKGVMVFFGDGKKVADKVDEKDTEKKTKDKLLFGGFSDFDSSKPNITISGERFWSGNKKGKYEVKIGFE
ncbi:MAG: hypothetical protein MUC29_03565 [Pyrinomonadaceae bacterium]|nr:hypothetical protein [Pyrinomonadaceae bacterium]